MSHESAGRLWNPGSGSELDRVVPQEQNTDTNVFRSRMFCQINSKLLLLFRIDHPLLVQLISPMWISRSLLDRLFQNADDMTPCVKAKSVKDLEINVFI